MKSTVGRGDGGSSRPWPRRSPCTTQRLPPRRAASTEHIVHRRDRHRARHRGAAQIAVADHERHRAIRRRLRARRVLGRARVRHRTQRRLPGRRAVTLPVQRQRRRRASDVRGRDAGIRACVREHVAVNVRPAVMVAVARVEGWRRS